MKLTKASILRLWLVVGLLATSSIAFAGVLYEWSPNGLPLSATAWMFLVSLFCLLGFLKSRSNQ